MDESQITGAASSYARKYALNGLFCIDDTKDADATNDHNGGKGKAAEELAKKAESAGVGSVQKYCCTDCGKEFGAYKDKSGKQWTAAQVFKMSQANNAAVIAWPKRAHRKREKNNGVIFSQTVVYYLNKWPSKF